MNIKRILRHLTSAMNKKFSSSALNQITEAVRQAEAGRDGQIRVAIEARLGLADLLSGKTPRQRAIEVFSRLRVWDTERNNGVLIYLCLADRQVEILADRGINALAGHAAWDAICQHMEADFRAKNFESGVLWGVQAVGQLLEQHYGPSKPLNELDDSPSIL